MTCRDSLGEQGRWITGNTSSQVWAGRLSNNRFVAALINIDNTTAAELALSWAMLPGNVAADAKYTVRDVWARKDLGEHSVSVTLTVDAQDSRMFVLTPAGP